VSAKRTKRPSTKTEQPARGQANLAQLRRLTEREIGATSPPELADLPTSFWVGAELVAPVAKEAISLRVDEDILAWFRAQGPRYQSRMNAVLRSYVSHVRRARKKVGAS
jgi:uncharacterized protein (DUF4415 family)